MKHLYEGDLLGSIPCRKCGKPARHRNHVINGGEACDVYEGPCACGAWHGISAIEEEKHGI